MDAATLRELQEAIRREARAELWRRREVWPLLELYLDRDQLSDARRIFEGVDIQRGQLPSEDFVLDISRQRGKSWLCCVIAATLCHCLPRFLVNYAAMEQKNCREIVAPTFNLILEDCPEDLRPRFDSVDNKWVWANGSRVKAFGCNNQHYKSGRGPRAHLNIEDECGFYDEYDAVQAVLAPQLQTTRGFSLFASSPPESPGHPHTQVAMAHKARGRYAHRTIYEHPRMSSEEVERFLSKEAAKKGMTLEAFKRTTYYRREFLAMHVIEETRAVVPEWSMAASDVDASLPEALLWGDTLVQEVAPPIFADTYSFADFGFTRDPSAILFAYWDFEGARLVVVDETAPLYRTRTDKLADAYREKCKVLWPASSPRPFADARHSKDGTYWKPYMAGGDQGGRGEEVLTDLAKEHGLGWVGANKVDLEIRVNEVRRMVAAGKVLVHPRCVFLRKQLAQGLWADKAKTDFERTSESHLDHLAALVDLVSILDRQRNPVPVGHGVDHTHMVNVRSHERRASTAISAAFG